jgi:hypothetical protein
MFSFDFFASYFVQYFIKIVPISRAYSVMARRSPLSQCVRYEAHSAKFEGFSEMVFYIHIQKQCRI